MAYLDYSGLSHFLDKLKTYFAKKTDTVLDTTLSRGRKENTTVGIGSIAFGHNVTASGVYSQAYGVETNATGLEAHAEGNLTTASGEQAHAEGFECEATANYAHAEGHNAKARSQAAHAEGMDTAALAADAHAEGLGSQAKGQHSHAEGYYTTAKGAQSHSEGNYTAANQIGTHTEGDNTIAAGAYSHVFGRFNVEDSYSNWPEWVANTEYSVGDKVKVTSGSTIYAYVCTTSNSDSQFDYSKWASQSSRMNYVEIVGNGSEDTIENNITTSHRSNARTLDWDGNERLAGGLYLNCNSDSTGGTNLHVENKETRVFGPTSLNYNQTYGDWAWSNVGGVKTIIPVVVGKTYRIDIDGTQYIYTSRASSSGTIAIGAENPADPGTEYDAGVLVAASTSGIFENIQIAVTKLATGNHTLTIDLLESAVYANDNQLVYASDIQDSPVVSGSGDNSYKIAGSSSYANGVFSTANGDGTYVAGNYAYAEGYKTYAAGHCSHAEGQKVSSGTISFDSQTYSYGALGVSSHSEGTNTSASGDGSHAEGSYALAIGQASHAEGSSTRAKGQWSHAEGYYAVAEGSYSHAEGFGGSYTRSGNTILARAVGDSSHTEGHLCRAGSDYSHAEGCKSRAMAMSAHAEGNATLASGICSHAEGSFSATNDTFTYNGTTYTYGAYGQASHSEGFNTAACGHYSHAEGNQTCALESSAHAEGTSTTASGSASHTEGSYTEATAQSAHVEGEYSKASGYTSHAEGYYTTATHAYQHVFGQCNILDTSTAGNLSRGTYVEIVGNGTDYTSRSNARTLDWNGNEWLAGNLTAAGGSITIGNTTITEAQLQALLALAPAAGVSF